MNKKLDIRADDSLMMFENRDRLIDSSKLKLVMLACSCLLLILSGCRAAVPILDVDPVVLPFLKNSPNECYYLDEFMPVPDALISGKTGSLDLRYYTYKLAQYKEWNKMEITLSFYSKNTRCWSLFEEYYVTD